MLKMRKLLPFFLFFTLSAKGQSDSLLLRLLDSRNKQPVPYANVKLLSSGKYTYSNEEGYFAVVMRLGDSLQISAVGYQSVFWRYQQKSDSLLYLQASFQELPEIVIQAKRENPGQWIGNFPQRKLKKKDVFKLVPSPSSRQALWISSPDTSRSYRLLQVGFHIERGYHTALFRVSFRGGQAEQPAELLKHHNITFTSEEVKKGLVILDISHLQIKMPPEGLWLQLECLGLIDRRSKLIHTEVFSYPDTPAFRKGTVVVYSKEQEHLLWKSFSPEKPLAKSNFKQVYGYGLRLLGGVEVEEW
jgi:hypothetical protein